jgi:hypothetical protein
VEITGDHANINGKASVCGLSSDHAALHQAFYWPPCAIHIPRLTWILTPWVRRVHVDAPFFFFAESLTDDYCAQIVVHYFEDGNVQLNTTKTFEHSTAASVCSVTRVT